MLSPSLLLSLCLTLLAVGLFLLWRARCRSRKRLAHTYWQEKVVLLTGGSQGIGEELAVELAARGALVSMCARSAPNLERVRARCVQASLQYLVASAPNSPSSGMSSSAEMPFDHLEQQAEKRVHVHVADVSAEEDCMQVVSGTVRAFGSVDVLVLNAAKSDTVLFGEAPDPALLMRRTMEVNLMQCVYFMKHALPHLLQSCGVVVPVSSIAGLVGTYGVSAYAASKHAMHGFFNSLRLEYRDRIHFVIFPLPYIRTTTALQNMQPISKSMGISAEDCAVEMCDVIPALPRQHVIGFDNRMGTFLSMLFPELFDRISISFVKSNFARWKTPPLGPS